ncbi:MAG: hypothetical protein ACI30I_08875, partial [Parabacteroides sp.]
QGCGHHVDVYTVPRAGVSKWTDVTYHTAYRLPANPILKKCTVVLNLFVTLFNLLHIRRRVVQGTDLLFFCCLDDYMNELMPKWLFSVCMPYPFTGLFLSPRKAGRYFHLDQRNVLSVPSCKAVGVLDEFCHPHMRPYQPNLVMFPDFADEAIPNEHYTWAVEILKKARGRTVISLLGAINPRKGVRTFVETARQMDDRAYFFVMAGKAFLTQAEYQYVHENFANRENCLFWDQRIPTEADFNRLVEVSDVIFAAYVNFSQSSNMFAKASLFRKPVIVSKGYYMEEIVQHYQIGRVIGQDSVTDCMEAIRYLERHAIEPSHYETYLSHHSRTRLSDCFQTLLSYYQS